METFAEGLAGAFLLLVGLGVVAAILSAFVGAWLEDWMEESLRDEEPIAYNDRGDQTTTRMD